jgi:cytochrome c peroxidase
MNKKRFVFLAVLGVAQVIPVVGCERSGGPGRQDAFFSDAEWKVVQTLSPVPPVPPDPTNAVGDDPAAATLGQKFYFDANFSGPLVHPDNLGPGGNGVVGQLRTISCARCHHPATGFSDRQSAGPTSLAANWTGRHAPTVYNSAFNPWFFWDGRKDSQWSQALGPVESSAEHNFNRTAVVRRIYRAYRPEYEAIFGAMPADFTDPTRFPDTDPPAYPGQGRPGDFAGSDLVPAIIDCYDDMTPGDRLLVDTGYANFGKCIAAYERLIVSRNAPFDLYVAGDDDAIGASAKRGLKLFVGKAFCINCHKGPDLSDHDFNNAGIAQSGPNVPPIDLGRFNGVPSVLGDPFNGSGIFSDSPAAGLAKLAGLSQQASQIGRFKTPTLRSISESAPYFHTGRLASLWDVVDFYNRGGDGSGFAGTADPGILPLGLSEEEVRDLVEFLKTLEGEDLPALLTTAPVIPIVPPGE